MPITKTLPVAAKNADDTALALAQFAQLGDGEPPPFNANEALSTHITNENFQNRYKIHTPYRLSPQVQAEHDARAEKMLADQENAQTMALTPESLEQAQREPAGVDQGVEDKRVAQQVKNIDYAPKTGEERNPLSIRERALQSEAAGQGEAAQNFRENPNVSFSAQLGGHLPYYEQLRKFAEGGYHGDHPLGGLLKFRDVINKAQTALGNESKDFNQSGLVNLLKQWGINTGDYKAPLSEAEAATGQVKLESEMQKALNELTEKEASLVKGKNEGKYYNALLRQDTAREGQDMQAFRAITGVFGPIAKKTQEDNTQIKSIESEVDQRDQDGKIITTMPQLKRAIANIARLYGEKGVLTDEDAKRALPTTITSLKGDITTFFNGEGAADPVLVEGLLQGLSRLREIKMRANISQTAAAANSMAKGSPRAYSKFFGKGMGGANYVNSILANNAAMGGYNISDATSHVPGGFNFQIAKESAAAPNKAIETPAQKKARLLNKHK